MKFLLFASVIFPLMFSCGKSDSGSAGGTPAKPVYTGPTFSLVNLQSTTWERDCELLPNSTKSRRYRLYLEDNTFRSETINYDGEGCKEEVKRVSYTWFNIGVTQDPKSKLEGWSTFVFTTDKVLSEVFQEIVAQYFSQKQYFGFTDWKVGEKKNVSGLRLDANEKPEDAKGSIWEKTLKVEGEMLYMAKYDKGVPKENRERPFKLIK